jgi:hypothetical protein
MALSDLATLTKEQQRTLFRLRSKKPFTALSTPIVYPLTQWKPKKVASVQVADRMPTLSDKPSIDVIQRRKKNFQKYNEELVPIALGFNQFFEKKNIPLKASAGLRSLSFAKILCDDGTCGGCMTKGAVRKYLKTHGIDFDKLLEKPPKAKITEVNAKDVEIPEVVSKDFKENPNVIFGNKVTVKTPSEDIPAQYGIVDLSYLQPSHLPNKGFRENPNYIEKCQQRDYQYDKSEQTKVREYARRFDPEFLITNDRTAVNGSPIIMENGMVLGGNGRTMVLMSISTDSYKKYKKLLEETSNLFGLTKQQINKVNKPVLVRIVEIPISKCATYSNILNTGFTQAIDLDTKALSYMRQLGASSLNEIGNLFEEKEINTLAEAFSKPAVYRQLQTILQRVGIITQQEYNAWINADGGFTEQGKLIFERILLGAVLEDTKLIDVAKTYTNHILKTIVILIKNKTLDDYSILPFIRSALYVIQRAEQNDLAKKYFVSQIDAFTEKTFTDEDVIIWNALDAGIRKWKLFLEDYTRLATNNQTEDLWKDQLTPIEILQKVAKHLDLLEYTSLADCELKENITLNDLLKLPPIDTIRLPRNLEAFLGRLPKKFSMLLWGPPGGGKSTFAFMLANALSSSGIVRYITSEEAIEGKSFRDRIKRTRTYKNIYAREINRFSDIVALLKATQNDFVFIDSVNKLDVKEKDLEKLTQMFPNISFIFIAHALKNKTSYRGSTDWAHDLDINIKVDQGLATSTKNRFSPVGEFRIF